MKWPSPDEWSAHLARYDGGQRHAETRARHGGIITGQGFERHTCPHCGSRGMWSSTRPDAVYCFPPGHRIVREDGAIYDVCPLERTAP